jgi:hypothetical protein
MPGKFCLGCREPLVGLVGTIMLCGACMVPATAAHKAVPFEHAGPAPYSYAVGAAIPEPPDQPHIPGPDSIEHLPSAEYGGTALATPRVRRLPPYAGGAAAAW